MMERSSGTSRRVRPPTNGRTRPAVYGIQGAAAGFVERVDGSVTNVIGLPLAETLVLLRDVASACPSLIGEAGLVVSPSPIGWHSRPSVANRRSTP